MKTLCLGSTCTGVLLQSSQLNRVSWIHLRIHLSTSVGSFRRDELLQCQIVPLWELGWKDAKTIQEDSLLYAYYNSMFWHMYLFKSSLCTHAPCWERNNGALCERAFGHWHVYCTQYVWAHKLIWVYVHMCCAEKKTTERTECREIYCLCKSPIPGPCPSQRSLSRLQATSAGIHRRHLGEQIFLSNIIKNCACIHTIFGPVFLGLFCIGNIFLDIQHAQSCCMRLYR